MAWSLYLWPRAASAAAGHTRARTRTCTPPCTQTAVHAKRAKEWQNVGRSATPQTATRVHAARRTRGVRGCASTACSAQHHFTVHRRRHTTTAKQHRKSKCGREREKSDAHAAQGRRPARVQQHPRVQHDLEVSLKNRTHSNESKSGASDSQWSASRSANVRVCARPNKETRHLRRWTSR